MIILVVLFTIICTFCSDIPIFTTVSNSPTIFIGILTIAETFPKRSLIRMTYLLKRPKNFDVKFVICKPVSKAQFELLALEANMYKDILILDCEENMNSGKTFSFFKTAAEINNKRRKKYDFVMKADDDSFLHLPNLNLLISGPKFPRQRLYFGRYHDDDPSLWMCGMGYILSSDLVEYIATNETIRQKFVKGQEDSLMKVN